MEMRVVCTSINFYPRSPCGERRRAKTIAAKIGDFYPRSPCGERRSPCMIWSNIFLFLSTLSLRRATGPRWTKCRHPPNFYPRSPCGERPPLPCLQVFMHHISIHALLAESDNIPLQRVSISDHFYPRSPCGERLVALRYDKGIEPFLSTLSLRRATPQTWQV